MKRKILKFGLIGNNTTMNDKSNTRKNYIDIAKGIGIYCIVLVHLTVRGTHFNQALLSFCVAFFFVLSGYLFSAKSNFKVHTVCLIEKLIIPLFLYGIVDAAVTVVYRYMNNYSLDMIESGKIFLHIFFLAGHANMNGPLWYLPVLFWIELLIYPFVKCYQNKKMPMLLLLISCLLIGYFIAFKGPFRIGQVPVAMVFFVIGFSIRPYIEELEKKSKRKIFMISVILMPLFGISCYLNGFSELAALNYGNCYILYYITALNATICIVLFSMAIGKNKFLEHFGRNSLTVMCCHYYFARYVLPSIFSYFKIGEVLNSPLVEIVTAFVLIIGMEPFILLTNQYFVSFTGKYKLHSIRKKLQE